MSYPCLKCGGYNCDGRGKCEFLLGDFDGGIDGFVSMMNIDAIQ